MPELERLQGRLRDTSDVVAATRQLARANSNSQAHNLTLRSLEKRQRALEQRLAKLESA